MTATMTRDKGQRPEPKRERGCRGGRQASRHGAAARVSRVVPIIFWATGILCPAFWSEMGVGPCMALTAQETLVVANERQPASLDLAAYYMARRGIPQGHLVKVDAGRGHQISRENYRKNILGPVVSAIQQAGSPTIRCLVLMEGLPGQVNGPTPPPEEQREREALKREEEELKKKLQLLGESKESEQYKAAARKLEENQKARQRLRRPLASATLDSELALALIPSYPLEGWVPNPAYVGADRGSRWASPNRVLVVGRLSGSSPEAIKERIDQTIRAEEEGLQGIAYFDARWPGSEDERNRAKSVFALYDLSIHQAAKIVSKSGILPVVLDDKQAVFQPGQGPSAALYCGWYSVGRYVDAFRWKPGAVGYHIESSSTWMRNLMAKGAAVTLGPIKEPYLQAFPLPHIFFTLLVQERMSVGEAFLLSVPYLSWQLLLVGDPLYRPFAKEPGR